MVISSKLFFLDKSNTLWTNELHLYSTGSEKSIDLILSIDLFQELKKKKTFTDFETNEC